MVLRSLPYLLPPTSYLLPPTSYLLPPPLTGVTKARMIGGMVTAERERRARPVWKRAAGRVLKRALNWRYRHFRPGSEPERWVRVAGLRLRVLPEVFNPALHFTSGFFAATLRRPGLIPPGGAV